MKELLELLVCPLDKAKLELLDGFLKCTQCGKKYEIKEGIPKFV